MLKTLTRGLRSSTPLTNANGNDGAATAHAPHGDTAINAQGEARYREMKKLAKQEGLPSAYLSTLPYRNREGVTFCAQVSGAANVLSEAAAQQTPFVNRDLMARLLEHLGASLDRTQLSGMGTQLNDADALRKAVKSYRHNLARIAPETPEILETFHLLEYLHKADDREAIPRLQRALKALQDCETLQAIKSFSRATRATHTAMISNPRLLEALPEAPTATATVKGRSYRGLASAWLRNKQLIPIARAHSRAFDGVHQARTASGKEKKSARQERHARGDTALQQLAPGALALELARTDNASLALFGKLSGHLPMKFEHWLEIAARSDLSRAAKMAITADFYARGLIPNVQTLLGDMERGTVWSVASNTPPRPFRSADLYLVLRTLCELSPNLAPEVLQRRDADLATWHDALWDLSHCSEPGAFDKFDRHQLHTSEASGMVIPPSVGAAGLERYPVESEQRIAFVLRACSDTQARGELQTMSTTRNPSGLLLEVARSRKPECMRFLLTRYQYTPTGLAQALHAMLHDAARADEVRPQGILDPTRGTMLEMAHQLVEHGAHLGGHAEGQASVLHDVATLRLHDDEPQAVRKLQQTLIQLMLKRGASVNGGNALGHTPFATRILQLKSAGKADPVAKLLRRNGGQVDTQLLLKRLRQCTQERLEDILPVAGEIGALSILLKDDKLLADAFAVLRKSPLTDHWSADTVRGLGYQLLNAKDRT